MPNRVAGGFSPPAPTPPRIRVPVCSRQAHGAVHTCLPAAGSLSGRSWIVNVHPQLFDRQKPFLLAAGKDP